MSEKLDFVGNLNLVPNQYADEVQFLVEVITVEDELIEEELMVGEEIPDITLLEEIITLDDDGK
jgi:hypothetical protein